MSGLDILRNALKSGEYDGDHIMQAWLLCDEVKQLQLANQSLREAAKAVIELAIKANAEISKLQSWNIATNKYDFYKTLTFELAHLTKFAELILASQAQPTPSQSELVACMYVNEDGECEEIGHLDNYNGIVPNEFTSLYTKPQPTQPQSVKDALEQAAQVCDDIGMRHHALVAQDIRHDYISGGCDACADAIRALIQETKGGGNDTH